ncbi:hypothetical protein GCM10007103_19030 [Salinimicrobium marinum]|uniref:Uncharacterized protein n=2 Tax=Salinimicrobium marinum TaxID=680283 RepID=A0A918VZI9_9FLAO|nr:hypothetical protein GCM10007103_19030 [Salinimicrobium marinum]
MVGVVKAFRPATVSELSQTISRPLGVLWLFTALLFFAALTAYYMKAERWPQITIAAVIMSQFLITLNWGDAKYGTILNFVIIAISIPAYGKMEFNNATLKEGSGLFENAEIENLKVHRPADFVSLPPAVQKWIKRSGSAVTSEIVTLRLKQQGKMRTKPDGSWMPFSAEQYFNVQDPGFVWTTRVQPMPLIYLHGRDQLKNGQGKMLIKLLSLFKVVDEKSNDRINSGTMIRYLSEICWFPSAAAKEYLHWEQIGKHTAQATIRVGDQKVSGTFSFSETGDFQSFEALRYRGGGKDAKQEPWLVEALDYREFNGTRIPSNCRVTWKLPDGDFTWLHLEITHLEYNVKHPYHSSETELSPTETYI